MAILVSLEHLVKPPEFSKASFHNDIWRTRFSLNGPPSNLWDYFSGAFCPETTRLTGEMVFRSLEWIHRSWLQTPQRYVMIEKVKLWQWVLRATLKAKRYLCRKKNYALEPISLHCSIKAYRPYSDLLASLRCSQINDTEHQKHSIASKSKII